MAKLRTCVLIQKFNCDGSETTDENLHLLLEEDDAMLHMSYTGSYDEASNLVKKHKKRKKSSKKTDASSMEVRDT